MPINKPDNRKSGDLNGFLENLHKLIEEISRKEPGSNNFVKIRGQAEDLLSQWYEDLCAAGLAHEADLARTACKSGDKNAVLQMLTVMNDAATNVLEPAVEESNSKCENCPHNENCPAKKGLELCKEAMQLCEIFEGISHSKINSTEYKVLLQQAKEIAEKAAGTEWRGTKAAAKLCFTIKFFSFSKWMVRNAMIDLINCYVKENEALMMQSIGERAIWELAEMLSGSGVICISFDIPIKEE